METMEILEFLRGLSSIVLDFSKGVLRLLPDIVWSGILGSFITFIGVWLTNRHHSKRADKQLLHDEEELEFQRIHEAVEADKSRKYDVRREIYLELYAQLVKGNVLLASFPTLKAETTSEGIQAVFSALAKASVLAEQKTVLLLTDIQFVFSSLVLNANSKNLDMYQLQSEQQIQQEIYEKSQLEIRRVLAAMTEYNESLVKDAEKFAALDRTFKFHSQLSGEASQKKNAAAQRFQDLLQEYGNDYVTKSASLMQLFLGLFENIRSELSLETDVNKIKERQEENLIFLRKGLDDLFMTINQRRNAQANSK
jgi:hypothetical protein